MSIKVWLSISIGALCIYSSFAGSESLSFEEFLQQARKHDPKMQEIIHEGLQTRFQKKLNLPNQRLLLRVQQEFGIQPGSSKTTSSLTASANKPIIETGTDLNLSFTANDQVDREERVQSAEIRQNVIRNAFGRQVRRKSDKLDKENQVLLFRVAEAYEDYVAQRAYDYLNFQLAYENYKLSESLYRDALALQKEVQQRKAKNIAAQVDVDRVLVQVLARERKRLEMRQELEVIRRSLARSLNQERDLPYDFLPADSIPFLAEKVATEEAMNAFWKHGRTAQIFKLSESVARQEIAIQNEDLYPDGDLIVGYNRDDSRRFTTETNREETVVGFGVSYAFDNSVERAELERAKFQKAQLELAQSFQRRKIMTELNQAALQIEMHQERLDVLAREVKVVRRLVSGERKRFQRGRVDLKTVIDAQNGLAEAQFNQTKQQIELAKAIVTWKNLSDSLIASNEMSRD